MAKPVYGIQILRALAATLVVVVHLGRALQLKGGVDLTPVTFNGGVGVDVFFVVSGFVMVHTTQHSLHFRGFLLRRVLRIAPFYWLMTLCYGTALYVAPGLSHFNAFEWRNFLSAFAFLPAYSPAGNILPPLEQGWTLVYEMFFYVCFAVASALLFRRRLALLGVGFAVLTGLGAAFPRGTNAFLVTYTNPILFEFLSGCVLCTIYEQGKLLLNRAQALALMGAAAAGLAASPFLMAHGWPRAVCWGLPALLATWSVLGLETSVAFKDMRIGQAIGDGSYAIYLTHVLVLSCLAVVFRFAWARGAGAVLLAPVFLALCLLAGWICHRLIEQPLTDAARRAFGVGRAGPGSILPQGQPQHLPGAP